MDTETTTPLTATATALAPPRQSRGPSLGQVLRRVVPEPVRRPLARTLRREPPSVETILRRLRLPDGIVFVQVGSNDGARGDPLHALVREKGWRGVLVEPVPFIYERLKRNHPDERRFACVNAAVGTAEEERDFHYLAEEAGRLLDLPFWFDQLGSFDREHIVAALGPRVAPFVRTERIRCRPLAAILEETGLTRIDLFHVDTEGFDHEVLKQLDLARFAPRVVIFEHKHLAPADRAATLERLAAHGYRFRTARDDTVAVRR